jgi:hypothetical protein
MPSIVVRGSSPSQPFGSYSRPMFMVQFHVHHPFPKSLFTDCSSTQRYRSRHFTDHSSNSTEKPESDGNRNVPIVAAGRSRKYQEGLRRRKESARRGWMRFSICFKARTEKQDPRTPLDPPRPVSPIPTLHNAATC